MSGEPGTGKLHEAVSTYYEGRSRRALEERGWEERQPPEALLALYPAGTGRPQPTAWTHSRRLLIAFVSYDELEPGELRWHISLRSAEGAGRVPNWEELVQAAHDLRPGVPFAVGIPPRSHWLNVHPDVLHLWELRDRALLEQWRAERQGQSPT